MLNLWGIPLWAFLLYGAVVVGLTWRRVRRGTVGGSLSVALAALSTATECGGFAVAMSPLHLSALGLELIAVLTLSSLLLDTWAKRVKKSQAPQAAIQGNHP